MKFVPLLLLTALSTSLVPGLNESLLEDKYGVEIQHTVLGYRINADVHGRRKRIADCSLFATTDDVDRQLGLTQRNMRYTLQYKYRVHIGTAGYLVRQTAYGRFGETSGEIPLRTPNIRELLVTEYALAHSNPGQYITRTPAAGLNIYFFSCNTDDSSSEWGFDHRNRASLFIEPSKSIDSTSLEHVLLHQLAHNSEYRMGWNPYQPYSWKAAKQLGWQPARNFENKQQEGWLIKSAEQPARYYRFIEKHAMWMCCDRKMRPLRNDGSRAGSTQEARMLTNAEMRSLAATKPLIDKFVSPVEVLADGLARFRDDPTWRAELLTTSPRLYWTVRQCDQKELDWTFGKGEYVRDVDGSLGSPDDDELLNRVRRLESKKTAV